MNRFRRLLLIAAINDYDPFPPPLFSADLRACVYICTRETMERALRSSVERSSRERKRERRLPYSEQQWRRTFILEPEKRGTSFRSIFKTLSASISHLLFSSRYWDRYEIERTRLERKEGSRGGARQGRTARRRLISRS